MNPAFPDRSLTHAQIAAFAAVVLVSAAWLVNAATRDPDVPFIGRTGLGYAGGPVWITPATPLDSNAIHVDLDRVRPVTFSRRFELADLPDSAEITARALQQAEYFLNGTPLTPQQPGTGSWKQPSVLSATGKLRQGENEVMVRNCNRSQNVCEISGGRSRNATARL